MKSELVAEVYNIAKEDLLRLRHPQHGWSAGWPKYLTLYPRDTAKGALLAFSCPPQLIPDWFIESTELAVEKMAEFQGTQFDPNRDEEVGRIFHELKNGHVPSVFKIEKFKPHEYQNADPYYGAGDTTSLFIELVAGMAEIKEARSTGEGKSYIEKLWPHVLAAYRHETQLADSSGYGLIDSIPINPKGLYFQTEHDSDYSYRTKEGETPRPPHFFLENNCHYVEALRRITEMAEIMGENGMAVDAARRNQIGKEVVHKTFYMKREGYYAPLMDGEGKRLEIITDDAIEGLWLGIFEDRFAKQVIKRLRKPDLDTPIGPRSLSLESSQFAQNGDKAYWGGNVWGQDVAKAAIGCERYGDARSAEELDEKLFRLVLTRRSEETIPVDEHGQLLRYEERRGCPAACNPQFWHAAGAYARAISWLNLLHGENYFLVPNLDLKKC